MNASSSQGPFMLAALIFVLLNSLVSDPENEQEAHALKDKSTTTQVVLKEVVSAAEVDAVILEN